MTARYVVAGLAIVLAGCGSKKTADDDAKTVKAQDIGKGSGDAAPKRAAITPKTLAPVVIHEITAENSVPTALVIELATPIIDKEGVGGPSPIANLKITPAVAGAFTHTGVSELTFKPTRPFDFDTTYQVELTAVDTLDGPVTPAAGEKWSYSFKTPAFKFLGWTPSDIDLEHKKITMDLAFSGAVLPNVANAAMTFTVDGKKPAGLTVVPGGNPSHVVVALSAPSLAVGSKVAVSFNNLVSLTNVKAPAAHAELQVSTDKVVSIKTAALVEGASGFYLEVVCDDRAAPPGHRAYYEAQGYYNLSQRCQLNDDAIKHIHFEPAVKKAYVTAGRAGFRVFGDFKRGGYKLKIDSGATSIDGGVTLAAFTSSFAVAARKPSLTFAASGRYLPRTAWTNLGIKHTNLDTANLIVRQVPAENLVFWMGEASDVATERTSNLILKKEVPLRGAPDAASTTWLDVASLLPATTKGVLEMTLIGVGTRATSRLLLTNMSLIAKKSTTPNKPWEQTVRVWALDMDSAEPLSDVEVSLVRQSGKAVAKCSTKGADGCTLTSKSDDDPDNAVPFAVIAKKGDDLTYIRYQDLRADVTESSTSGAPYVLDVPYRAAVYLDRGVYRPGDTAHVVAIVRDARDRAPEQPLPVDIVVFDPRAKVVKKTTLKTNTAGEIALDQAFPAFADTGHWRVEMTVADKALAAHDLQVEEFMPERMAVTATPKAEQALIGAPVAIDVNARYLFGGSAMDSGVELNCSAEPQAFTPDENADLTYGVPVRGKAVVLGQAKEQLDPAGKVTITCPESDNGTKLTRTTKLTAQVSVLEAGSGRATVRQTQTTLHPEKFYLGVRGSATRAESGTPITVEGSVVDWNGKLAAGAANNVHVEIGRLESDYGYAYDDTSGDASYGRWLRKVSEGKQDARISNGKFSFTFTPGEASNGYVVRVTSGKAVTELLINGEYAWDYYDEDGYGGGYDRYADQTPRPAKPTRLAVKLPKAAEVGKPTTVTVRSPYKGKVLWTVETDALVTAEWKDIAAGEATWSFTLGKFAPNVYVSAFVVKDPHLESKDAFMPDRAFGVASLKVTPTEMTQPLAVTAPREVRSSSPLSVTLDAGKTDGPAFATVAVVDEGILSLTNFATPDPLVQLFGKRALGVETYETIGWTMLHQPAGASSKTGGGDDGTGEEGGEGQGGRVQPVKPVALWSGVVPVGADGKLTIPFQVPQYRGQLRVMAIVATPGRVGRAETKVTVRDPLTIQTTFPRFVTQNDELEIPVFLTNMSGGAMEVSVALDSEPLAIPGMALPKATTAPLAIGGNARGTIKLANGFSDTVVFHVTAQLAYGAGKLRVVARGKGQAGSFEAKDDVDVPFLPAGPRERAVERIKLDAGANDLLAKSTALKNWTPTSEKTTFWMTANPYAESFDHLQYLVHYPYGCLEQTSSSIRPLLYIASLVEQVDPQMAELKTEDMVLAGINRILSMETPSGGFGYWPGDTKPVDWATAYAVDTLLDAKKRGYAVPDDRLNAVVAWIEQRAAAYERGERSTREPWNHYDEQTETYLQYVLARAGKGKKARLVALLKNLPGKTFEEMSENIYLLKAALYIAGDRRYEKDLKNPDVAPIIDTRINSWSFYSDRRYRGVMLNVFFDLFGNDPAGELLAQRVADGLRGHYSYWYNTQELVWGVTGLGKWVNAVAARGAADGVLTADGAKLKAHAGKHRSNDKAWSMMRASEAKQLTLDVPASAAGMWLVISSEGVRPGNDYKVGGNGLAITRTYKTLAGEDVDLSQGTLKLGDLVFVEVELRNTSDAYTQNIAVVDRLPAGFEIENPRLGRDTKPEWVKDEEQWVPDFMNMRDDRVEAFGSLGGKGKVKITYTLRAVTSGKFTIPPVEAEAMYDPTLWAREKGGTAVVGGPWTGKTL